MQLSASLDIGRVFYLLLHPSQEVIRPGQQTNPGAATVAAPKKFRTPKPHSQALHRLLFKLTLLRSRFWQEKPQRR